MKLSRGKVYISSTYNNTIVSISDLNGNILGWSSAGILGFKGAKRATPYAASLIVKDAINKVRNTGIKTVDIYVKGIGSGRESAIRAFPSNRIEINSISDTTPIPHNGCRPPKPRRV